ncbi:hypothetical protein Bca52824_016639 [Brassica carinata]|uniref:RNase H type-1 domain-containing protein n=1 Tax=Brassica carinata TaxID=52824 RepID=A0A8X7W5G8_BRACI|nr:hypothetical protein Bca52824_016639 [Brassica carinata]
MKCNVGAAWSQGAWNSGAAWILRDHRGRTSHHSRRAFSGCLSSCESELQALLWSLQALKDLRDWSLEHVVTERNRVAMLIAKSVINGNRFQSYVATGGPLWLNPAIREEASNVDA